MWQSKGKMGERQNVEGRKRCLSFAFSTFNIRHSIFIMLAHYTYIFLAPHLDDVVLSCGGQIAQYTQAGETVLIVSITAGNPSLDNLPPFAQAHHISWALDEDAVAGRRR
ncbi:MAG TPA: hypothetical protein ENJ56_03875, partial [Anaerolineae bacterium]|nr:hypothetical protein [Anaerolineae bacterium]